VGRTAGSANQIYTLQTGDSLSKISQRFYGDANKYNAIVKANNLEIPTKSSRDKNWSYQQRSGRKGGPRVGLGRPLRSAHTGDHKMETKVERGQSQEDSFTGSIERQTSKAPSTVFLGLALGSMAASLILKLSRKDDWALFVGQWAAPFLIMGNYNKMVKQHGSEAGSRSNQVRAA
jgi:hypothetical protein